MTTNADDRAGWRLTVESTRCVSSGLCVGIAPEHFAMEQVSRPLAEVVAPAGEVVEAADSCPVEAISVVDARTRAPIAPQG